MSIMRKLELHSMSFRVLGMRPISMGLEEDLEEECRARMGRLHLRCRLVREDMGTDMVIIRPRLLRSPALDQVLTSHL